MELSTSKLVNLTLQDVEYEHIAKSMPYFDWNRSVAAKTFGITRNSLAKKLEVMQTLGYTIPKVIQGRRSRRAYVPVT